jgi:uncharacterized membrane protein YccC
VRYRRTLSKEAAQAIVARTQLHADGTPELAARIFMNSAAVDEIDKAATPEEQVEKIDNALVAAAREVQEEARLAKEQAEEAKARAAEAEAAAEERAREAERQQADAIERERALREEAVRNEAARGDEALRNEIARADQLRADQDAQHRRELDAANRRAARQGAIARRTSRRLRLGVSLVVGVVIFTVVGLAVGLDAAWTYVVGFGVLLSVLAGIDQFANRSDPVPDAQDDVGNDAESNS